MSKAKTVMIIAGEASGDMHGASLVREMLKIDPHINFYGIGGNKLQDAGVKLMVNASEMAVVGLTEVFSKLSKIIRVMNLMKKSLDEMRPDLVILIDYAGFNLRFARAVHKRGIKIFYYISPQIWASRPGRIKLIKKLVDKMAVILPFEVDTYKEKGFAVDYVGHPLLDLVHANYVKVKLRKKFNFNEDKVIVGLLPGSRLSEVEKLLSEMMKAAAILSQRIPDIQFVLPLADSLQKEDVLEIISQTGVKVNVISGSTYEVISCTDLAIVASGTATLEAALLGIPMIIVYRISPLTYFIGKMVVTVKNIGIVNIIAGKTIVPELIQHEATGIRIAEETLSILTDNKRKREMINHLGGIRARLGTPGAAMRAAKLAYNMF
jgi:lipid-A-disaccharide synthase